MADRVACRVLLRDDVEQRHVPNLVSQPAPSVAACTESASHENARIVVTAGAVRCGDSSSDAQPRPGAARRWQQRATPGVFLRGLRRRWAHQFPAQRVVPLAMRRLPLYQSRGISGTTLESSAQPLQRPFLAMQLPTRPSNVSALQRVRQAGAICRSAWLMKHKVKQPPRLGEDRCELSGLVPFDDVDLGGELRGCKTGPGSQNKASFVAAMQATPCGQPVVV